MKPMKLQALYDALVAADVVDPDEQPVLPMAIADGYLELSKELDPSDDQKKLLFECCVMLVAHNFRGLRPDAQGKQMALLMNNPGFEFRPAPEEPETPEIEE